MRRALLFLSRFVLSLWAILVVAFLILLLSNAPNVPISAPFAGVSINPGDGSSIYLPNRIFSCAETEQNFQCQATLQGQQLDLVLDKGSEHARDLRNCQAQYDSRSVGCQETGMTYAPILANNYEVTHLRLSPQALQAIQQKYKGINTLKQLGEIRLFRISSGLSLAAGISAVFFTWLHPGAFSKGFVSFAAGFGIYHLVWPFLGRVPYNAVTPYGLTPNTWDWVVDGGAIAAGVSITLATAILLWRNLHGVAKGLISLITSVAVLSLAWLSLQLIFTFSRNPIQTVVSQYLGSAGWDFVTLGISIVLAIMAAIWLISHTRQSIKRFLSLGSGLGASMIAMYSFIYLLLGLGYAD